MSDQTPKQSDQLPEEGPAAQVPDDVPQAPQGAARESGHDQAARNTGRAHRDREDDR
jgi:hypothetical protein